VDIQAALTVIGRRKERDEPGWIDFRQTSLQKTNLKEANLVEANLKEANLVMRTCGK
jgi:uncharacterized protein YjbI with pentapeptide repeats